MKYLKGDIWDYHNKNSFICIPINLGWTKDNKNVMGAGLAKQAKEKFKDLDKDIGEYCRLRSEILEENWLFDYDFSLDYKRRLQYFATKPLNVKEPWLSWKQNSSLEVIKNSCYILQNILISSSTVFKSNFYLPLVGCGNGKLNKSDVLPILQEYFNNFDNVFLVEGNNERY